MKSNNPDYDVNIIIKKLLSLKKSNNNKICLSDSEIIWICNKSKEIFLNQSPLLEIVAPINICGDIHGQYFDLIRLFEYGGLPDDTNYLFLGDYVDRGKNSVETICLLFCYKIANPENFFLLRGNHESEEINKVYGFYDECRKKYSVKIWKIFIDTFNCMPISALIDDKIFCCHGGISPELKDMNQIKNIIRPTEIPETGLLCDLLWSDPDKNTLKWGPNERGISVTFSENVLFSFMNEHKLDLICRAHQVVEQGYEFFGNRQLVTIFSAPNYCNQFDNSAAILVIDESLKCKFKIIKGSCYLPKKED